MNEITEGTPIYFTHAVEGLAIPFEAICEALPVPAFVLQCIPGTPDDSIQTLARHYYGVREKTTEMKYHCRG